jgi:hypothetical protein
MLPDVLNSELVQLLLPVSKALLVLGHDFLILFEFVTHFNLDSSSFVEDGGLRVELALECLELFLLGVQGLYLVSISFLMDIRLKNIPLGLPPLLCGTLQCS